MVTQVKMWGTRGLLSSPRQATKKFGGNTTCISLSCGTNSLIIDAGFGIANLGENLMLSNTALTVHIAFTHLHWDHIQGLSFFQPIYDPRNTLHLYSPFPVEVLRHSLNHLFDGSYTPFESIDTMPAKIHFHQMSQFTTIAGFTLQFQRTLHGHAGNPCGGCFAFRIATPEKSSIVAALDHEACESPLNEELIQMGQDSDLLIHNSQFTEKEYQSYRGWGHSTPEQALQNAARMHAKKLLLTHHAPWRSDADLEKKQRSLQKKAAKLGIHLSFATEIDTYEVYERTDSLKELKVG